MAFDIEKEMKLYFFAGVIVDFIFGLVYLFAAELWVAMAGWPFYDPVAGRLIGSFITASAIANLLAFRNPDWEKTGLFIIMSTIWCILGAISMLWGHVVHNLPPAAWLNTIILIVFAVLGAHICIENNK